MAGFGGFVLLAGTPFLDYRLVELAMRMPAHHKMRLRTGKLLLRDVAQRTLHVPSERSKRGLWPPVGPWLRSTPGEVMRGALSDPVVRRRGIFDPDAVRRVREGCLAGDVCMVPPAMMLYSFETWAQRWLDAPPRRVPSASARPSFRSPAAPVLSVVVVNWNTRELLRECLASVTRRLAVVNHELIVVDNASADGSVEMVAADFPKARLIRNAENAGFGTANNQAMAAARGEWFLLLNSDTLLTDESVARLFELVQGQRDLGVAHCRVRFPDGRLQHTTYRFPSVGLALLENFGLHKLLGRRRSGETLLGAFWNQDHERDVDWVAGVFMLVQRAVFEATGGFDERLFMYGEDLEWCARIRDRGWRIGYFPQAEITHRDHASAEMLYGDGREALCLRRSQDFVRDRQGAPTAAALLAVRVTGTGLRAAWYTLRGRLGGRRGQAYRDMAPAVSSTFRALRAIARGR